MQNIILNQKYYASAEPCFPGYVYIKNLLKITYMAVPWKYITSHCSIYTQILDILMKNQVKKTKTVSKTMFVAIILGFILPSHM